MKLFNWMQSKFRAGDGDKRDEKNNPKEEVMSDWRNGLLRIGTLGYKDETFELDEPTQIPECLSPDFSEFTTEEVRSLQKELTKLLRQKSAPKVEEEAACDLPLHKFLNYPSTLDQELDSDEGGIDRTIRIILGRCKDAAGQKKRSTSIGRKSLCFLINKIFLCLSGFDSTPSFRDTFQVSRMEKLMRAMLMEKIHHPNSPTKKCMEDHRHTHNAENEERFNARNNGGFKWDKTDSEFIVLDI